MLLVLHGGPGWPNAVFTLPLRPWEKHFTVVQWDHRGAGQDPGRNGKAGSGEMTFDRRVADAIEVIEVLRQHLGKDKVILLAESMGTLTGTPLVKLRPDLFHALVATDLYVNMVRNEARKYQLTLERLGAAGQHQGRGRPGTDRRRSDPLGPGGLERQHGLGVQDQCAHAQPGPPAAVPLALSSPLYSLWDLYSLFTGFQSSTAQMFSELMAYDAWRLGTRFEVPFFLFQGETDVVTLTTLAEEYFEEVEAPTKAGPHQGRRPLRRVHPAGAFRPSCAPAPPHPLAPGPAPHPPGRRDSGLPVTLSPVP